MSDISVVVATYNGARFVDRQLRSIAAQTLPPAELLVADDGSDDGTIDLARSVLEGSPFHCDIRQNPRRLGVTGNFESLVARAQGEIIVLCDQDDEWVPRRLEVLNEVFEQNPNIGGVFSDGDLIGDDSEALHRSLWDAVGFSPDRRRAWDAQPFPVLMRGNVVTGAALAFRSKLRTEILPFSRCGWHDYWIAMILTMGDGLMALDERLVRYRLHATNQAGLPLRGIARVRDRLSRRAGIDMGELVQLAEAVERLVALDRRPLPPSLLGRMEHLRFRDALPESPLGRLSTVIRHAPSLVDYWRYSGGAPTLASDLVRAH